VPAKEDDQMMLEQEEDDDPSNLSFNNGDDDLFGFDLLSSMLDGTNGDERHSPKSPTPNIDDTTPTMMCRDEDPHPRTAEEDVEFTNIEVATLGLMQLCDAFGAHHGFFDDLLTLLHGFCKKKVDITKAKGCVKFVKAMQTKVKCSRPMSRKVGGCDVIYFPFFDLLQDILKHCVL
jgi:hypothetical protein